MQRPLFFLALLVVTAVLLWLRFPDFFAHTNTRFIEPWGDGYKTYDAIFYHVDHDTTLSHFAGMNYPYGEQVVPGDCQPLFSNTLKILKSIGLDVTPYGVGILHIFLLTSLLLCAVFLYLIFTRLGLPPWYSLLVAIGLAFFSPQIDRMLSHFGLAHPEVLPLAFYLLLRWHEKPHWRWSLALGAMVWAYALLHFYFFAILTFAIVGWVGVRWLVRRDWAATLGYLGHGLLMLGLPLVFFYAWMIYPDPVTDRNPVPWGFFNYRSRLSGVFTDMSQPHWQWVNNHLVKVHVPDFEAKAYVGLVAMAFLLFCLLQWLRSRLRTWPLAPTNEREKYLHYLLLSGIAISLFAYGLPFILPYGKDFLKYTGPIQQFRSIGRFAWVFFYAVNISAFYYLYQWSQAAVQPWQRWTLLLLPLGALAFESYHFNTSRPIDLDEVENWVPGERFTDRSIDYSRFQACLPIPYFNIGSDNFWWEATGWISQKPFTLSMQTGLPLTAAMLTRTSLSQTLNQLQLVTEPYRWPRIFADYPNDKPLLLFWDNVRVHEFGDQFIHLNQHAKLLYENDWQHLYELPLASFTLRLQDKIRAVQAQMDTLAVRPDGWLSTDTLTDWLYQPFDQYPTPDAYFGAGQLTGNMSDRTRLLDTVWQSSYTGEVTVSFWQFLNSDRAARAAITWVEYDAETGAELFRQERISRLVATVFDDRGWALMAFSLPRQKANSRIELSVRNDDQKEGPLLIDELLIRPTGSTVARRTPAGWWWNNRWYPVALLEAPGVNRTQ
jgi:hypothetical protein